MAVAESKPSQINSPAEAYMQTATLKYRATASSHGYRQLEQAMLDMGNLYNALIRHRNTATGSHRRRWSLKLQNAHLTDLHRNDPVYNRYARRLLASAARRVNTSFSEYFKRPERGRPRTSSPYRLNTMEISEPAVGHLKLSEDGRKGYVHIKGLPRLQFKPNNRLPEGVQPRIIRITRTPSRYNVLLVFNQEITPEPAPNQSVGIDPGVKHLLTAVNQTGQVAQVPGLKDREHRKVMRRLRRKMQRQRDSALKDGRARFVSHKLSNSRTRRRFRWTDGPSHNYLKSLAMLRRVEQKRQDSLAGLQHRITSQLVKDHQVVCIEDTRISNMVRSARGTVDKPGTNVRQKSGLNRSILFQGWYGIRQKLEYKCQWYSRSLVPVPAINTSRLCGKCGSIDEANRRSQALFKCTDCGHTANADVNAAENIRRQGLNLLARAENRPSGRPGRAAGSPTGKQAHKAGLEALASRP